MQELAEVYKPAMSLSCKSTKGIPGVHQASVLANSFESCQYCNKLQRRRTQLAKQTQQTMQRGLDSFPGLLGVSHALLSRA